MAEYIEREALIAKAKTLPLGRGELWTGGERPKFVNLADVVKAPAADVVEVVRCGQCKWWSDDRCQNIAGAHTLVFNPKWFCGSGERRDNDVY